jgi:hypothetical protein
MAVISRLAWGLCRTALIAVSAASCGDVLKSVPSDATPDTGTAPDATVTEASMCEPLTAFSAPVPLSIPNGIQSNGVPRFSADELQLYSDFLGDNSVKTDLFSLSRSSLTSDFIANTTVGLVNSAFADNHPFLSRDGLTLWFESGRGGAGIQVFVATRATTFASFAGANVSTINGNTNDGQPLVSYEGGSESELWFISDRANPDPLLGNYNILKSSINSGGLSPPTFVNELNSNDQDFFPTVSADGLTIYISSNRPGGLGRFDIWRSHRQIVSDPFPAPIPVPELNDANDNFASWISKDNCRLYGRNGQGYTVATRQR